ncbi:hypothetical protein M406DRAFT_353782 [Cryphonectria parasitica EP155]|uniref:Malate dehydrogenase n=1 Tax=Cryphonectria parasitica (strain ATCC 38755 / EP155) TaxID=660469 RepID=A0A9P4XSU5_CRYP1|nr:uncharacterized protein M406DRAFT_353782 [Cryphonectria parasitica EP155]KAF3760181.1 hypothetical protein M406DRAFT_353782 [Cryphonectria parasitica EP155]
MRTSILVSALCASTALAAPTYPQLNVDAATPSSVDDLSEYFNLLAQKISSGKQMSSSPTCDLSKAVLPVASASPLPTVNAGLTLKHVAIGRGTQNYTCDTSNATAAPTAIGAAATLFNATCIASTYPDLLAMLPGVALNFNLSTASSYPANLVPASTDERLAPGDYMISGHHYFLDSTTPFFNLNTTNWELGEAPCAKNATTNAPAGSPTGQSGDGAVAWLKLTAREGATGKLQEVYRVETAGGSPPATCAGMDAAFEVQYSAQYWFYESDS